jgi:hypothetical protein
MAQKKQKKRKLPKALASHLLPTEERMRVGDIVIRNNRGVAEEPLRIDKLLANGIIDEMQHLYGMQIITLWTIASRPFLKAIQYEARTGGSFAPNFEQINLSRMSAEDQFYKTMRQLSARDHGLIRRICLEEMAAIAAGKELGLAINSVTVYVRAAFDALGNALAQMRRERKALQKAAETEVQTEEA